jgi:uncharacterized repeat protein (TIGR02543 family)
MYRPSFFRNTHTVVVTKSTGGKVVSTTSSLPQINCGTACSNVYEEGSTVTLQAIPDSAYWRFVGWSGACSGATLTCTIHVNPASPNSINVTATFAPRKFDYIEF